MTTLDQRRAHGESARQGTDPRPDTTTPLPFDADTPALPPLGDERLAAEAQLRSRKLLALGTLAGDIAHDFGDALQSITGNTALAQRCLEPGHPARALLDEVARAGARAEALVERIVQFSRPDPRERGELSLHGEPRASAPRVAKPDDDTHGARVLFVDDEEALVSLGTHMLEVLGYQVSSTSQPLAALKRFASDPRAYDAVVTDLSMPGLSGFQLSQQLLAVRPDLPIVVLCGYVGPDERSFARKVGVRELLLKPAGMDDLRRTLSRVLSVPTRRVAIHKS